MLAKMKRPRKPHVLHWGVDIAMTLLSYLATSSTTDNAHTLWSVSLRSRNAPKKFLLTHRRTCRRIFTACHSHKTSPNHGNNLMLIQRRMDKYIVLEFRQWSTIWHLKMRALELHLSTLGKNLWNNFEQKIQDAVGYLQQDIIYTDFWNGQNKAFYFLWMHSICGKI